MDQATLHASLLIAFNKDELIFEAARYLVDHGYATNNGSPPDQESLKTWYPLTLTRKGVKALWPNAD